MSNSTILKQVSDYYTDKLVKHGATPQGVDWNGEQSQTVRFNQLLKVCEDASGRFSLLDYGCGYGALYDVILASGLDCDYVGFDCAESMIEKARELHPPSGQLRFVAGETFSETVDYTVASGIFNVKGTEIGADTWLDYILKTLQAINEVSRKGFAANLLTAYSDREKMRDYLYYADPCSLFDYCKRNFSRNVALLHDYDLYEFTLVVKK